MWATPSLNQLEEAIAEPCSPIGMRMRAAYFLRQSYDKSKKSDRKTNNSNSLQEDGIPEIIDYNTSLDDLTQERVIHALGKGLRDRNHGSLMRHEFAYVMGQLRDERVGAITQRLHICFKIIFC